MAENHEPSFVPTANIDLIITAIAITTRTTKITTMMIKLIKIIIMIVIMTTKRF